MIVFHHTWSRWLRSILAEGIRLAPHDRSLLAKGERPLVWCSLAEHEPAAYPHNDARVILPGHMAPLDWYGAIKYANMPGPLVRAEEMGAAMWGSNVYQWRFATVPIPPSYFLAVEVFDEDQNQWRPW